MTHALLIKKIITDKSICDNEKVIHSGEKRLVPSQILLIRVYESRNTWNKKLHFFPFVNNVLLF
jgi:hypothetical protein